MPVPRVQFCSIDSSKLHGFATCLLHGLLAVPLELKSVRTGDHREPLLKRKTSRRDFFFFSFDRWRTAFWNGRRCALGVRRAAVKIEHRRIPITVRCPVFYVTEKWLVEGIDLKVIRPCVRIVSPSLAFLRPSPCNSQNIVSMYTTSTAQCILVTGWFLVFILYIITWYTRGDRRGEGLWNLSIF